MSVFASVDISGFLFVSKTTKLLELITPFDGNKDTF